MNRPRLLLVHAHPDDETITTGATMAHYAAAGAQVTLLTCTLGEEGEIVLPAYAGLEAARADQLGGFRIAELAAAMRALGVEDHRFLGGAGAFRDSGMLGTPPNQHRRAFWRAASEPAVFAAAVSAVVDVVQEVRPHVVVTYDPDGDYGHPDHVMAHRVATAGVRAAADRTYGAGVPWTVAKTYWTATPRSVLLADAEAVAQAPDTGFVPERSPAYGVPDDVITATVDAGAQVTAKRAALSAHGTQVTVNGEFYALSNHVGRRISGREHFRLADGVAGDTVGREDDLFAGVTP